MDCLYGIGGGWFSAGLRLKANGRDGRGKGHAGPSTALRFAQDDTVWVVCGRATATTKAKAKNTSKSKKQRRKQKAKAATRAASAF
jgi:hypothetical protein